MKSSKRIVVVVVVVVVKSTVVVCFSYFLITDLIRNLAEQYLG